MRFIILERKGKTKASLKVPVASGASSGKGDASLKGGRVLQVNTGPELLRNKYLQRVYFCDCQGFLPKFRPSKSVKFAEQVTSRHKNSYQKVG